MKKIIFLSFFFVITSQITSAQSWIWSKKIIPPIYNFGNSGLLTDKDGNVFSYGSKSTNAYYDPSTDTTGSYLQCYSTNGVLLFSKQWKVSFHIQKMDYDGSDYFYFSGKFFGTQTIDAITIVSQGNADGVIGKMNLSGHILWMKTYGGSGEDAANGICYNPTDSSIYVTGGIKDTLFFNNTYQSVNAQSAIICHYSSNGNLMNYKLYDFLPLQKNMNTNCGVEICRNLSGNLFVLMDRKADRWWSSDPGTGPVVGRYLIKLNSNLDTLWSTRINGPQSYYGWDCDNLRVSAHGDIYITNENSGKYGGDAQLLRLNGNTGNISWSLSNRDGIYEDVFIDSNTVYLIGIEGANECPCEFSHPGYFVIKKIDENNIVVGETRVSRVGLNNITKDLSGNIFVTGGFGYKSVTIGPDIILGDSLLAEIGNYYYHAGKFLSKLSDINCAAPVISVSIPSVPSGRYYPICPGDTIGLTVNPTAGSFIWSNGNTGLQTNVGSTSNYSVVNNQPNGCIAYSLPVSVIVNENINSHKICVVTYNNSIHKNTIVVREDDYNYYMDIKQINLFKKVGNSIMPVSSTTTGNSTVFTDSTSSPDSVSVEYYISTIDTCNTESDLSLMHKSIFLKVNTDSNNKKALSWNAYVGIPITGYRIWRGSSANALVLVDSVGPSQTTYSDQISDTNHYFYQIQTMNQGLCYVNNTAYRASYSNIAKDNLVLDIAASSSNNSFDVYPNPTRGSFQIRYSSTEKNKLQVNVFNTKGEKVFEERVSQFNGEYNKSIDLSKQANGVYFIEISANGKREMKKIVLD